jgi:S1-C subfamily serine protease
VELSNIYDYVGALNGLVPGDPVEIVVRRGGERVELEIVPGVRE